MISVGQLGKVQDRQVMWWPIQQSHQITTRIALYSIHRETFKTLKRLK